MDRIFPRELNQLLGLRFKEKLKRWLGGFQSPRRRWIASIGIVLGFIWISQAVLGILFRRAAEHQSMVQWMAFGLTLYVVWQLLKTVTRKQFEPHEWTPAEKEFLLTAPIPRHQLVTYRLTAIATATLIKALFVSIVMIPDLEIWPVGVAGLFLGLLFVEVIRVSFELIFFGLGSKLRWVCRASVLLALLCPIAVVWYRTLLVLSETPVHDVPMSILLFKTVLSEMNSLANSAVGVGVLSLMAGFSEAIFMQSLTGAGLINFVKVLLLTSAGLILVYRLDEWFLSRIKLHEELAARKGRFNLTIGLVNRVAKPVPVRVPLRIKGMGAVAWRQLVSAYNYRMTLAISLGIPAALCWCPLFLDSNPEATLISVVGGLLFYSFLLLPSALVLDFRRDLDRFEILKALPVGTIWIALGQLTAPVLLATGFQTGVLLIATLFSSIIWPQALLAALMLVGFNLLIFTGENLIFLLSPYRRNQEGLDVFIRTVLTFTGKGIVFAIAVSGLMIWATLSVVIVSSFSLTVGWAVALFCGGLWAMIAVVEVVLLIGVVRLFDRFDPSQDCPVLS
jgi:hypothetical protein